MTICYYNLCKLLIEHSNGIILLDKHRQLFISESNEKYTILYVNHLDFDNSNLKYLIESGTLTTSSTLHKLLSEAEKIIDKRILKECSFPLFIFFFNIFLLKS